MVNILPPIYRWGILVPGAEPNPIRIGKTPKPQYQPLEPTSFLPLTQPPMLMDHSLTERLSGGATTRMPPCCARGYTGGETRKNSIKMSRHRASVSYSVQLNVRPRAEILDRSSSQHIFRSAANWPCLVQRRRVLLDLRSGERKDAPWV